MNVYLVIVLANVFLTLGNAIQGQRLQHRDAITVCAIVFAGKLLVGLGAYSWQGKFSWSELHTWEVLALLGVGILTGLGEAFLFNGLTRNTMLVSALGCLYPLLLAFWAALLSKDWPHPLMFIAVVLAGVSVWVAHIATTLQQTPAT